MIEKTLPYVIAFVGALVLTLILTPLVREINRRLGMVDKPDPRRINKVPIPRGGGLAIVIGVFVSYGLFTHFTGRPALQVVSDAVFLKMTTLGFAIAALGFADDLVSLSPKVKLLGQVVVASLVWFWAGLGFGDMWPALPAWIDCIITVLWIVGAVNAFNLIDGLDGLATGLAFIAILGMAGGLFFTQNPQATLFYFAMLGGLVGFLRYNYNPASVFLGDCGSMFLGFTVATLPLASHVTNSFLVSVGVPLLAMGVPIFDTSLAIVRRSLRHLLVKRSRTEVGNDKVMTADVDHLHHRILRSMGMNQRRAAWTLYALAAAGVIVGLVGLSLQSRAAGLWLLALAAAAVVVFRDMASIELFDAGRLLNSVAHNTTAASRRRWARLAIPCYVAADVLALIGAFFLVCWVLRIDVSVSMLRTSLPLRVASTFFLLIFFRTYATAWSRALGSNFMRLFLACAFGSVIGTALVYYAPMVPASQYKAFCLLYALLPFVLLAFLRTFRGTVRDLFYAIDCSRLKARKDVSRILVYGAGLRYRSFRRELVRTTAANDRMIVGLLDDDVTLRGKYIGGIQIMGTLNQAPEIINRVNADAVVIACQVTDEWMRVVRKVLAPTGVRITHFNFSEQEVK